MSTSQSPADTPSSPDDATREPSISSAPQPQFAAHRPHAARRFVLPVLLLVAGLAAAGLAASGLRALGEARDRERFDRLAAQHESRIREHLETYTALLRGVAGLHAATGTVSRAAFVRYAGRIRLAEHYPGARGLGFARRLRPGEAEAVQEAERREGEPGFRVWPALDEGERTTITVLEPRDARNIAAIGFDMTSEAVRRAAMWRARDRGEPALSGRVELVQEIDRNKQAGFLLYLPVYEGGDVPPTLAERQARLAGWAYTPFRSGDLFSRIPLPASSAGPEIAYRILDGGPDEEALIYESAPAASPAGAPLATRRPIEIAGHPWTLAVAATPAFSRDPLNGSWPYALGLGILATLAVSGAALAQAGANHRSEAARLALLEERESLELLNRTGTALVSEHDIHRLVQTIIEGATQLVGGRYGAFFERVPAGDEDGSEDAWRLSSLTGGPREAFTRFGLPRATQLFRPTFLAEGIVRSDDVTRDPRYGSHGGMPKGHLPVASYLAVPVVSGGGETLGALLFGHPEPGRFGAREERLITGFAAQAAVALDNARLVGSIRHERERFQAAVKAVRGIMWTNDAAGRMTGEQPGWSAITGQTRRAYEGYGWAAAVHPEDAEPTVTAWKQAVAERRTFIFEHRVRSRDGGWRHYAIRGVPILDTQGEIREWVGVHTDITEQRRAEAELRESNEEIQRYAYIVSHDLRAPLVNVMGFTSEIEAVRAEIREAMGEHPNAARIDADLGEALGFIRAAITKMEGLIAAILRLSREGRRTFRPEPLDMRAVVRSLADAQHHQALASGAEVAIAEDLPALVADRLAVEQIFGNLIDNALKYRAPGRPPRVRVEGRPVGGGRLCFTVADNGRGIAAQDHGRIFELFRRAGVQDRPGEGIGLAHVRTLVRSLGGTIDVASQPGEGTTFSVTLPAEPATGQGPRGGDAGSAG